MHKAVADEIRRMAISSKGEHSGTGVILGSPPHARTYAAPARRAIAFSESPSPREGLGWVGLRSNFKKQGIFDMRVLVQFEWWHRRLACEPHSGDSAL